MEDFRSPRAVKMMGPVRKVLLSLLENIAYANTSAARMANQ